MAEKLFGTDGVRGIANQYPLTIDFCIKLATVLGQQFCEKHKKVAIARDTRISGSMLFSSLCAGFTANGIDVIDLGVIPTPLCTTLTATLNVDMSIMITASHNPFQDNGLKLINENGDKFTDAQTSLLEQKLNKLTDDNCFSPNKIGQVQKIYAGLENYLSTIKTFALPNSLSGMKIVLDSANGALSGILGPVFEYLGAETINLACFPDGYNINADCGSQHTEKLCKCVVDNKFDLGIAVDGDGDRIIICDESGHRLDGDQIIAFLATYFKKHNMLKANAVVATVYSNLGLGKYINSLGIKYYTSTVGERYVIEKMREVGSNIGGEESGHMVLSDYSKTGDALITAVVICLGIKETTQKVSAIFPLFKPFPASSHNLRFDNKEIINQIMASPIVQNCISDIKNRLQDHGLILMRKSGTEPVIRLKIEDESANLAENETQKLLNCIEKTAKELNTNV